MLILRLYIIVLSVIFGLAFSQRVAAEPDYTSPFNMRGEAVGTVLKHNTGLVVQSETTRIDVREWQPLIYNPQLNVEMVYELKVTEPTEFDASLFVLLGSKRPKILLNDAELTPQVTKVPMQQSFYLNSFRGVNGHQNPFGKIIGQETLQGFVSHHLPLQNGSNTLRVQQAFDVHLDSSHFINHYGFFVLNPQWQSRQQGLVKAWDFSIEVLVPPAWTIQSPHMFERVGNVTTFRLMPSEATFQCTLIPPHNNHLYKLVKTSLWLVLGVGALLSSLMAFGMAHAVMRYPIAPRIGMLLIVVLGMAINWSVAESLATYLLSEASQHHLSLNTLSEIRHHHWQHNFYGALLTALVGCLVFLRTLEIPFFNTPEPEPAPEESEEEHPQPVEEPEPEAPVEQQYFTMVPGADEEDDETPDVL